MDSFRDKIQFICRPTQSDNEDLSQECTAYLKTKQFMANRIYQQQEEIEMLKQNVIFHSGKHIQMHEMLKNLTEQLDIIRPSINNLRKEEGVAPLIQNNFEDSNELIVSNDLTNSFVCDENFENISDNNHKNLEEKKFPHLHNKNVFTAEENFITANSQENSKFGELNQARKENIEFKKELEKLKIQLLEQTLELNKIKTDKFILFNELNELIQSLRRVDLEKLNTYVKNNLKMKNFNKVDMPSAKGLKYNVLSAQSHLGKIIKSDLITKKLKRMEEDHIEEEKVKGAKDDCDLLQMETYLNLLKRTEEEFDALLDRKLAKRSKSFNIS